MTTPLKKYLSDPENTVAFFVDLEYRDIDADTVSTQRISDRKILDSDYLSGLLVDPGGRSVTVEVDELSGVAGAVSQPIVFSNEPQTVGGVGALEFLRNKSLAERATKVYAGDPTFPPPGTPWWTHLEHDGVDDHCDVGDFCDVGAADSFFVMARWRVGSVGVFQWPVGKKGATGAANAGWGVRQDDAGTMRWIVSDGTDQKAPGANLTVIEGEVAVAVMVLDRGTNEVRGYLDGTLDATADASAVDSLATATTMGLGSINGSGGQPLDGDLIEVAWGLRVPTDTEIANWVDRPLDEVADDCVLWRIDDGSGPAVTAAASPQALTDSGAATLSDLDATITSATWGKATEDDFPWGQMGSGVAEGEPEFSSEENLMTLRVKSAMERLGKDLDVQSYVGEPSGLKILTSSGNAKTSDNAAHHLTEFTLSYRFRQGSGYTGSPLHTQRQSAGSARNWGVGFGFANGSIGGKVAVFWSTSGVNDRKLLSTSDLDDGEMHTVVVARSDAHAYLMVDGVVEDQADNPSEPDLPSDGILMSNNTQSTDNIFLDHRIFNHYIAPNEMRATMGVRATGDEDGLVGLWRGDDAVGPTLTDHSSTGADAAISGTEGTDFEWVSSDLGEPEIAGRSMALWIGLVYLAKLDLVSTAFERYRVADKFEYTTASPRRVYDQGEELTVTTDYTLEAGNTIVAMASQAGKPVTAQGFGNTAQELPMDVIRDALLIDRLGFTKEDLSLHRLGPAHQSGVAIWTRKVEGSELVRNLVEGMLAYLAQDRNGVLTMGSMSRPVSPSPRDGPCIEMYSLVSSDQSSLAHIEWAGSAALVSTVEFTLCCWVKIDNPGPWSGAGVPARLNLIDANRQTGNGQVRWVITFNEGTPQIQLQRLLSDSVIGVTDVFYTDIVGNPGWHFLAVTHSDATSEATFWAAVEGDPAVHKVGTVPSLFTSAPATDGVRVGGTEAIPHFKGSTFEPQGWDKVLTESEVNEVFDGNPSSTTGRSFFATLAGTGGEALKDQESSEAGSITGDILERPNMTVDLTKSPRKITRRALRPAKRIEVGWNRNYSPLSDSEFAGVVSQRDRLSLQRKFEELSWESEAVADDNLGARDIRIETPFVQVEGGNAVLRLAIDRFRSGREAAVLEVSDSDRPNRESWMLEIEDEIHIIGQGDLSGGVSFRVIEVSAKWRGNDVDVGLWR